MTGAELAIRIAGAAVTGGAGLFLLGWAISRVVLRASSAADKRLDAEARRIRRYRPINPTFVLFAAALLMLALCGVFIFLPAQAP